MNKYMLLFAIILLSGCGTTMECSQVRPGAPQVCQFVSEEQHQLNMQKQQLQLQLAQQAAQERAVAIQRQAQERQLILQERHEKQQAAIRQQRAAQKMAAENQKRLAEQQKKVQDDIIACQVWHDKNCHMTTSTNCVPAQECKIVNGEKVCWDSKSCSQSNKLVCSGKAPDNCN